MVSKLTSEPMEANADAGRVVTCHDLSKVFRGLTPRGIKAVHALQCVSFTIRPGQIIGLIGPNGAGKSTLLNLVAGIVLPTQGTVTVYGCPARSVAARRYLGFVPEHPVFPGMYSARAVLRYHGALWGLSRTAIKTRIDGLIPQLQMQEWIDRPASAFSQGMKQRLALGIALMSEPRLLLLDEPSNGLDPMGVIQLRALLKQLQEAGTTVIVSSHRLGELDKLTSDYLFMHRGQIVSIEDPVVARGTGQLCIELKSDGAALAAQPLLEKQIVQADETKLVLAVEDPDDVPDIVSALVRHDARIMNVFWRRESIEDVFVRLCQKNN
jgi:ABC-2 type transport system ATP-binding protein